MHLSAADAAVQSDATVSAATAPSTSHTAEPAGASLASTAAAVGAELYCQHAEYVRIAVLS